VAAAAAVTASATVLVFVVTRPKLNGHRCRGRRREGAGTTDGEGGDASRRAREAGV
jgi:hypothetical protein